MPNTVSFWNGFQLVPKGAGNSRGELPPQPHCAHCFPRAQTAPTMGKRLTSQGMAGSRVSPSGGTPSQQEAAVSSGNCGLPDSRALTMPGCRGLPAGREVVSAEMSSALRPGLTQQSLVVGDHQLARCCPVGLGMQGQNPGSSLSTAAGQRPAPEPSSHCLCLGLRGKPRESRPASLLTLSRVA